MTAIEFFRHYCSALKSALDNDKENLGFHVLGADYFFPENILHEMDEFIVNNKEYIDFFDKVGYYFDAKSHYLDNVKGVNIEKYKIDILLELKKICRSFNAELENDEETSCFGF